ncbi:MAG: hypothetical protein JEZ04_10720 [Spirochaetales bacterium]|nr:hypothetical protein [Spirochaetales bacterium]
MEFVLKKFMFSIFYVVLLFLCLYPFVIFVCGNLLKNYNTNILYRDTPTADFLISRLHEVKEVRDVDILFLGSSHAYRGFDPRNFPEYKIFNLASSSQTEIQTRFLLDSYLDQLNPKIVVYEVFPELLKNDGVESAVRFLSFEKLSSGIILMALRTLDIRVLNTLIYKFMAKILNKDSNISETQIKKNQKYIPGGYVEREISFGVKEDFSEYEIDLKTNQFRHFKKNIKLLKQRDIPVVLVFAPIIENRYNRYLNIILFNQAMSEITTYINFNDIMNLDDNIDFYDSHHLNQNGVNKFNKKLLIKIKELEK